MNDLELIQRVLLNDDQRAFEELVKLHQSSIRYSIRQWTRWDEALADDLAQEVFLKAYRKLEQFSGKAKFSTWLYRIAYNTWLNYLEKKQLETDSLDDQFDQIGEEGMESTKIQMDLEKAMAKLPENQRIAIHLCLQKGISHGEASEIMGVPLGTVKTNVNRGKSQLQSLMQGYQKQEEQHG